MDTASTSAADDVIAQGELKAALAAVGVGVWTWNAVTGAVRWSPELCVLFGCAAAPASYEAYLALIAPEDRARLHKVIEDAMRAATETKASTSYLVEHRVLLADGTVRWLEGRGRVLVDANGSVSSVTGTAADISARKDTEERLRKSEELLRMVSELGSDYVYVADLSKPTLVPAIVAGSFERTTGMMPADVEARGGWFEVIVPSDRAALANVLPMILEGKPSVNEYRIADSQGLVRWLRDSVRPMRDPLTGAVVAIMGSVQDITERKQLEEQLLQAQKLEALARLSGGIAHDFNNLLAVVMGSISLLAERAHDHETRLCCDAIQEAAERGAELTRSLLVFARRDTGTPRVVNLGDVVRDALPMLVRGVGPHHNVLLEHVEPLSVSIDPGQAQLLLLNLAINARDAMSPGGTIRLTIHELNNVEGSALPRELAAPAYARLCVTDNGAGISPDVMPRLFEPFFTTKARGAGTGLGLAACHGIVQHAGGAIHVSSVVGQGSTFSIYLPLASQHESIAESARVRHSPGGTERILIVEDEKRLQFLLARALRDRGYTVVPADSAEQALAELERAAFDLILSDIVLPGLDGTELVPIVRKRWPRVAIVLMSGYPGAASLPAGILSLPKPFTIDRLAMHVRQALDATTRHDSTLPRA